MTAWWSMTYVFHCFFPILGIATAYSAIPYHNEVFVRANSMCWFLTSPQWIQWTKQTPWLKCSLRNDIAPWCPIVHVCSQWDKTRQLYTAIRYQQSANWHISYTIFKDTAIRYTAIYSYQISAIYHTFALKQFSFNTFSLFAELENDPVWMRHTLISSGQGQEWFSVNIALENLPCIDEFPSYKPACIDI